MNYSTALHKIESIPDHWDACLPNDMARLNAKHTVKTIWEQFNLLPSNISPTVESGIYIKYGNKKTSLIIENYNDGESSGVVSVNKSIKMSLDLNGDKNLINITKFYSDAQARQ